MVIHVGALQELINLIPGGVRGSLGQRHGAGNVPERMVVVRRSGIHVRKPQPVERVNVAGIVVHCRFESGDRVRVILALQGRKPDRAIEHCALWLDILSELLIGGVGWFLELLKHFQPVVRIAVSTGELGGSFGIVRLENEREHIAQESERIQVIRVRLQCLFPCLDGLVALIELEIGLHFCQVGARLEIRGGELLEECLREGNLLVQVFLRRHRVVCVIFIPALPLRLFGLLGRRLQVAHGGQPHGPGSAARNLGCRGTGREADQ